MRKIIHIDMDCFYAAVEMRDNPRLQYIPLAIGGSREKRGVISTANYIARQYGVRSAMASATALKLCPHLKILPGRFEVYREVSRQLNLIFQRFTNIVEPVSLDEAYLDVSESDLYQGSATLIAEEIRRNIKAELNLTASAGIAPLKFVAKIASDINKPDGITVIPPEQISDFITTLPLRKIPGVGRISARKLADLGLLTCGDVQGSDLAQLLRRFGQSGRIIWERSHGIDPRPITSDRQRKSVGVERTLEQDIYSFEQCLKVIDALYPELERRLRQLRADLRIAKQGIKLKFSDFQQTTQEHVFGQLDKAYLIEMAEQSFLQRRGDRGIRLVGLHVTLLDPMLDRQLVLGW